MRTPAAALQCKSLRSSENRYGVISLGGLYPGRGTIYVYEILKHCGFYVLKAVATPCTSENARCSGGTYSLIFGVNIGVLRFYCFLKIRKLAHNFMDNKHKAVIAQ
jgi:hypothetical protein